MKTKCCGVLCSSQKIEKFFRRLNFSQSLPFNAQWFRYSVYWAEPPINPSSPPPPQKFQIQSVNKITYNYNIHQIIYWVIYYPTAQMSSNFLWNNSHKLSLEPVKCNNPINLNIVEYLYSICLLIFYSFNEVG